MENINLISQINNVLLSIHPLKPFCLHFILAVYVSLNQYEDEGIMLTSVSLRMLDRKLYIT